MLAVNFICLTFHTSHSGFQIREKTHYERNKHINIWRFWQIADNGVKTCLNLLLLTTIRVQCGRINVRLGRGKTACDLTVLSCVWWYHFIATELKPKLKFCRNACFVGRQTLYDLQRQNKYTEKDSVVILIMIIFWLRLMFKTYRSLEHTEGFQSIFPLSFHQQNRPKFIPYCILHADAGKSWDKWGEQRKKNEGSRGG